MLVRNLAYTGVIIIIVVSFTNILFLTFHQKREISSQALLCPVAHRLIMVQKYCRWASVVRTQNGKAIPYGPPNLNSTNLFVDTQFKLLVSAQQSVAAKFWRMLYAVTRGMNTDQSRFEGKSDMQILRFLNISTLSEFRLQKDKLRVLHTFMRIVIVQHPFTHLVKMHSRMNKRLSMLSQPEISFKEFTQFVTDGNRSGIPELQSMHDILQPCNLKYHVILRLESVREDILPLVHMVSPRLDARYLQRNLQWHNWAEGESSASGVEYLREYDSLSVTEIKDLLTMYKSDFKMFGYSLNTTAKGLIAICHYNKMNCC
ncbi:hypothetical protein CAPTEDRAFT_219526 [Capitella teleta]|uniref:Carbohydrate sulfotransferase n=1 Tax=Capitella teleta TaxID=283909 RepID=R7TSL8_CAPTE|nr:hypothetical protein CAPTEDRAFT_219526 [Capitella teleta]|eukprot:ELT96649.1 hypothetical protein CAPTEDRAFT_219526 [Capitella teleta]